MANVAVLTDSAASIPEQELSAFLAVLAPSTFTEQQMSRLRSIKFLVLIGVVLALVASCVNLPDLLFWSLCWGQDHDLPLNTEVIVSACRSPVAVGVPGGELIFVHENRPENMYLLDLRTGEKKAIPDDPLFPERGVFLNSELVWLEGSPVGPDNPNYRPHYILDLKTAQRYELLDLDWLPKLDGGKFDPRNFAYIQSAEQVFIHRSKNTLIALSADFRSNPNGRVILSQHSLASFDEGYKHGELLAKLINDLGMEHEDVDLSPRYTDVPSPTGRYVVRSDGIYLSETNTPVVTREYTGGAYMGLYFKSWYYDESGVVVQRGGHHLLILPGTLSLFYIPSPLLKLRLP